MTERPPIDPDALRGLCSYCGQRVRFEPAIRIGTAHTHSVSVSESNAETLTVNVLQCSDPDCARASVVARRTRKVRSRPSGPVQRVEVPGALYWPPPSSGRVVPSGTPWEIAEDFREAEAILHLSPKASAALSRRCLQHILETFAQDELDGLKGWDRSNLRKQIDAVEGSLPAYLKKETLHALREFGNFAAHPEHEDGRDDMVDRVIDVEPGEASFMLDVVEQLLDHYIERPRQAAERAAAAKAKRSSAKKKG